MSRCLRCGADSSWLEGDVPPEPKRKSPAVASLTAKVAALTKERDTALARIKAMEERVAAMREALAECLSWMRCDCGHPACKRCPATKDGDAALAEREAT